MNEKTSPTTPAATFRSGSLQVAVWKTVREGKTFYNATPTRSYTADDGKTWNHATDFGQQDLPVIAALLIRAWEWCLADRLRKSPTAA